jgi:hypothetical protein
MNVGITTVKRFYASAMALLFCTGFMGESLHYAWVAHERCEAHGELVHESHQKQVSASWHTHEAGHSHEHAQHVDHHHDVVLNHDTQSNSTSLKINNDTTDAHDHCSLCDFSRDDFIEAEFASTTKAVLPPHVFQAVTGQTLQHFLPIALLRLAPKHAPPGFIA